MVISADVILGLVAVTKPFEKHRDNHNSKSTVLEQRHTRRILAQVNISR